MGTIGPLDHRVPWDIVLMESPLWWLGSRCARCNVASRPNWSDEAIGLLHQNLMKTVPMGLFGTVELTSLAAPMLDLLGQIGPMGQMTLGSSGWMGVRFNEMIGYNWFYSSTIRCHVIRDHRGINEITGSIETSSKWCYEPIGLNNFIYSVEKAQGPSLFIPW